MISELLLSILEAKGELKPVEKAPLIGRGENNEITEICDPPLEYHDQEIELSPEEAIAFRESGALRLGRTPHVIWRGVAAVWVAAWEHHASMACLIRVKYFPAGIEAAPPEDTASRAEALQHQETIRALKSDPQRLIEAISKHYLGVFKFAFVLKHLAEFDRAGIDSSSRAVAETLQKIRQSHLETFGVEPAWHSEFCTK